jgi:hypothetical protein
VRSRFITVARALVPASRAHFGVAEIGVGHLGEAAVTERRKGSSVIRPAPMCALALIPPHDCLAGVTGDQNRFPAGRAAVRSVSRARVQLA